MLAEMELDVLHFFDRDALEGLQMHSRYLRDLINRHTGTLPLRHIYRVMVSASVSYLLAKKSVYTAFVQRIGDNHFLQFKHILCSRISDY